MANEVFTIDCMHPQPRAMQKAAEVMAEGGIALFPTDTIYEVGSLARAGAGAAAGINRLIDFKNRGGAPSFPWLVSSVKRLDVYGIDISDEARHLASEFWPGALSIVVKASAAVPRVLAREDGTVALRMSASPVVSGLLSALDKPIVSTGANMHGVPSPMSFDEVDPSIVEAVDVVLDAGPAQCKGRSTIVDCSQGDVRILREGVISRNEIDSALGIRTPLV